MAHWPIRSETRLGEAARREIEILVARAADLERIVAVAKEQTAASQPDVVLGVLSDTLTIPAPDLRSIFNSLENIRLIEEDQGSLNGALDRVRSGLPPEMAVLFDEARPKITASAEAYDQNNPVSLSFKAQRLVYLREKLFHDAEIVTDARPVFDESGQKIVEFVVTHDLVMTYYSNRDFITEHMSIDNADILKIRRACDRAVVKAGTLKEALGSKWKTEVLRDDAET